MTARDIVMAAAGATPEKNMYVVFASNENPTSTTGLFIYPWSSSTGYGTRVTSPTDAYSTYKSACFNSDCTLLLGGKDSPRATGPFVEVWPFNPVTKTFGTKYANPSSIPSGGVVNVGLARFTPSDNSIIYNYTNSTGTSTGYSEHPFNKTTGFGTRKDASVSNSSSAAPKFNISNLGETSTGYYFTAPVFPGAITSRFFYLRHIEESTNTLTSGFTVLGSNSNLYNAVFHPTDKVIAFARNNSPYIQAISFTDLSTIGTTYPNPSTMLTNGCRDVVFSKTGNAVIAVNGTSPYIHAYAWSTSTGFGTKYSNPSELFQDTLSTMAISPDNKAVIAGYVGSGPTYGEWTTAYQWNDTTGFGAKYSSPPGGGFNYRIFDISFGEY